MNRIIRPLLRLSLAIFVLVGLSAGTAFGQDIYVDASPSGPTSGTLGSVGNPYTSLADAVEKANTDGAVQVIAVVPNDYDGTSDDAVGGLNTGDPTPAITDNITFQTWDGANPGTFNDPGEIVLNGDLAIEDPAVIVTLDEGFTLEFEQNRVLTLAGAEIPDRGATIGGQGQLLIGTASGEFTINITNDGGTNPPPSLVRATIQNLAVDKPNGAVDVVRSPADPTLTAELGIWDGGGAVGPAGFATLNVVAGTVSTNRNDIRFVADTGDDPDDGNNTDADDPADPFPVLSINSDASIDGVGSLILQVTGENEFVADGTGDLGLLLQQQSAPVNGETTTDNRGGTTVSFASIGNGGNSQVLADTLRAPSLETINGSLTVDGTNTFVSAPILEGVTADLRVENEASATIGDSGTDLEVGDELRVRAAATFASDAPLTVVGDTEVSGSSATFNNLTTFDGTFSVDDTGTSSTVDFNFVTTFNGDVNLNGKIGINFNAPGIAVDATEPQSNINGDLTAQGDPKITLFDDVVNGSGLHNLAFNGDITIADDGASFAPSVTQNGDTRVFFAGTTGGQDFTINDLQGFSLDRLTVRNDVEIAEASEVFTVIEDLRLEDGVFNTNGNLNANGIELTRVRTSDGNGELFRGNSDIAYTATTPIDDFNDVDFPDRIEYQGSVNISTGDELLPAGLPSQVRRANEFAVNMQGNSEAVVTLGVDYTIINTTEILAGNLSLGSATLSLFNQSTFVRGDGELDPGPVPPEDALIFPDTPGELGVPDPFMVGTDGINIEYVNTTDRTVGIEFPSNSVNPDLIIDLTVDSEAAISLAEGNTYRVNDDVFLTAGTLDFNGQTFELNSVEVNDDAGIELTYQSEAELAGEGLFRFVGSGKGDVEGVTSAAGTIFPFPAVEVDKPDDDDTDGPFDEPRRVTFEIDDNSGTDNDGFSFGADFTMTAAQDFDDTGDGDGVITDGDGVEFGDDVDIIDIAGNFTQNAGSFLAFGTSDGESFTVAGNLTKVASDTSRFVIGGVGSSLTTYQVADFAVGTADSSNTLTQSTGTFLVQVSNSFTVNGDLENSSDDAIGFSSFASDAFGVLGSSNDTFNVTGNLTQNAGNLLVSGFTGNDGSVSIGGSLTQNGGNGAIPNATTTGVTGDVKIMSGNFEGNLGNSASIDNSFTASTLTVGDSTDASASAVASKAAFPGAEATFSVSQAGLTSFLFSFDLGDAVENPGAKVNGTVDADDVITIPGATAINYDAQFYLNGYELQQGGDFVLLGSGDDFFEDGDSNPDNDGLRGLVRFNGSGETMQSVMTDGTPSTYFNSLAVEGAGIALMSDIALNTANVGPSDGINRNFGTLFLNGGNIMTGENSVTVLQPTPTFSNDLAQAINADEEVGNGDNAGTPVVGQTPIIGGSRNSHIVGTMIRAIEQTSGSTGGFVTDGYIYPLGMDGQYQSVVVQTPTDLGSTRMVTVTITEEPEAPQIDIQAPGLDQISDELVDITLELDRVSAPFFNVEFDEDPNEDFNLRVIAGGLQGVDDIKQMRIVQFNEETGSWQLAGIYDLTGDNNDDIEDLPNSFISGVPNIIHEGVDFREGGIIGLASDGDYNSLSGSEGRTIAGAVTYGGEAVEGATVTATDGDTELTTTTDADGNYSISEVPAGSYEVSASVSGAVSGVNSTDALLAVRGFAGLTELSNFQTELADVNDSGNVNATDALLIAQFGAGAVTSFEAGTFASTTATADASTQNVQGADLMVAAYGDVNMSGSVGSSSEAALSVSDISSAAKSAPSIDGVEGGTTFEIPVRANQDVTMGAYTLAFTFPTEDVSFEGVSAAEEGVITHSTNGTVRVAWYDNSGERPISLNRGDEILTLKFKAANNVEKGSTFGLESVKGEFAGSKAQVLADVGLQVPQAAFGPKLPDTFSLKGNYPNPFTAQTQVAFDLPEDAQVSLQVYDILGRQVMSLPQQSMAAGATQSFSVDGSRLGSGVYLYRVIVEMGSQTIEETGRMTVVK